MSTRLGGDIKAAVGDPAQIVEELHLAQRAQGHAIRTVMRIDTAVTVRPADSAARALDTAIGRTRELRNTTLVAAFPIPIVVGSFFQLAFDANDIDLPPLFARCDRCTLLGEDEFEARFHFLQAVVLPSTRATGSD